MLDDKVRDLTITTTFEMGSLNDILIVTCETLNLNLTRNGNAILLSAKK